MEIYFSVMFIIFQILTLFYFTLIPFAQTKFKIKLSLLALFAHPLALWINYVVCCEIIHIITRFDYIAYFVYKAR